MQKLCVFFSAWSDLASGKLYNGFKMIISYWIVPHGMCYVSSSVFQGSVVEATDVFHHEGNFTGFYCSLGSGKTFQNLVADWLFSFT